MSGLDDRFRLRSLRALKWFGEFGTFSFSRISVLEKFVLPLLIIDGKSLSDREFVKECCLRFE